MTAATVSAPSQLRLTGVELRKATDTRASRWLLAAVVLCSLALTVVQLVTGNAADNSLYGFFGLAQLGMGILLPVVGVLAITAEWSQRTALTTFALEPRRGKLILGKLLAGVSLVIAACAASLVIAAVANIVAPMVTDASASWSFGADDFARAVLFQLTGFLVGAAFGLAVLSTPLAIVAYFALPTVWGILGSVISSLETVASWLDFTLTTEPLLDGGLDGTGWAQLATSMAVWFGIPLALGLFRVLRTEIK